MERLTRAERRWLAETRLPSSPASTLTCIAARSPCAQLDQPQAQVKASRLEGRPAMNACSIDLPEATLKENEKELELTLPRPCIKGEELLGEKEAARPATRSSEKTKRLKFFPVESIREREGSPLATTKECVERRLELPGSTAPEDEIMCREGPESRSERTRVPPEPFGAETEASERDPSRAPEIVVMVTYPALILLDSVPEEPELEDLFRTIPAEREACVKDDEILQCRRRGQRIWRGDRLRGAREGKQEEKHNGRYEGPRKDCSAKAPQSTEVSPGDRALQRDRPH